MENWIVVAHFNKNSKKLNELKKIHNENIQLIKLDLKKINNLNLKKYKKIIQDVDSFVSLTGFLKNNSFNKIDLKNLYDHLNVNFISNIYFINFIMKNMIKKRWGRILLSSSIGTKFGGGNSTYYYSLSKFMNEFIPSEFRRKYAKYILYNVLQIGVTDTKIHKKISSKKFEIKNKINTDSKNSIYQRSSKKNIIFIV